MISQISDLDKDKQYGNDERKNVMIMMVRISGRRFVHHLQIEIVGQVHDIVFGINHPNIEVKNCHPNLVVRQNIRRTQKVFFVL